jgi:hypothetical protein
LSHEFRQNPGRLLTGTLRIFERQPNVNITIRNHAKHLLICTLNSGRTIHLAPAEISGWLAHLEISGNQKIDKLVRTGRVSIAIVDPENNEGEEKANEEKAGAAAVRRQRKERE